MLGTCRERCAHIECVLAHISLQHRKYTRMNARLFVRYVFATRRAHLQLDLLTFPNTDLLRAHAFHVVCVCCRVSARLVCIYGMCECACPDGGASVRLSKCSTRSRVPESCLRTLELVLGWLVWNVSTHDANTAHITHIREHPKWRRDAFDNRAQQRPNYARNAIEL